MKICNEKHFFPHISQIVLTFFGGIIFGIAIRLWTEITFDYLAFFGGIISVVVLLLFYKNRQSWIIVMTIIGVIIGFLHTNKAFEYSEDSKDGQKINAKFEIISQPTSSARFLRAYGYSKKYGKILLNFARYSNVVQGSIVQVECKLKSPKKINDFDYPKYLLMNKVNYICNVKSYEILGYNNNYLNKIASVRRLFEGNISKMMPAPESGLANGLIFGGNNRLSEEMQNSFAVTGMTHIVAVSGYNVSVIVLTVITIAIFVGFWRKQASFFAVLAIIIFVAMIGFPSSGIRAAIMGIIVLFSIVFGRISNSLNLVVLSATIMLLWNPLQLRYDIGFQLSFLAVIGILSIYPIFEKFIVIKYKAFTITEILFLTISAQLFVLPVILVNFHVLSLSCIITNLLILPILPITMLLVFLASVISIFSFAIASPFVWLSYFFLLYEIKIIEFFANQKWNIIFIKDFPISLIIFYYLALFLIVYYFKKRVKM